MEEGRKQEEEGEVEHDAAEWPDRLLRSRGRAATLRPRQSLMIACSFLFDAYLCSSIIMTAKILQSIMESLHEHFPPLFCTPVTEPATPLGLLGQLPKAV